MPFLNMNVFNFTEEGDTEWIFLKKQQTATPF